MVKYASSMIIEGIERALVTLKEAAVRAKKPAVRAGATAAIILSGYGIVDQGVKSVGAEGPSTTSTPIPTRTATVTPTPTATPDAFAGLKDALGVMRDLKEVNKELNDVFGGSTKELVPQQPQVGSLVKDREVTTERLAVCNPVVHVVEKPVLVEKQLDPTLRCFTPQGLDDELRDRLDKKFAPLKEKADADVKTAQDAQQKIEASLNGARLEIARLRDQAGFHWGDAAVGGVGGIVFMAGVGYGGRRLGVW